MMIAPAARGVARDRDDEYEYEYNDDDAAVTRVVAIRGGRIVSVMTEFSAFSLSRCVHLASNKNVVSILRTEVRTLRKYHATTGPATGFAVHLKST